jgi:signal transduction histidine kinase
MPGEGKITIETRNIVLDKGVRTTNREADSREYVLLKITDTAHGIEKEVQHRIFELFSPPKNREKEPALGYLWFTVL